MEEFNMVPIYRNGLGEITRGIDVPVPKFCKKKCQCNEKCLEYYRQLENASEGIYQCPYGFSSYVFKIADDNFIFTCLRVAGYYNRDRLLPKLKNEDKEYRELTFAGVKRYAEAYREYYINQNKYIDYKKFIDDIFHDIRKFNQQIKLKNDRIYRKAQQHTRFGGILEDSKSIYVTSWFLTLRMNNHDFIYNQDLMDADIPSSYNIYKIFDKVKRCMKERMEDKNIKILMNSNYQCRDMQAYDCIELLPFSLLDNAIKYSPKGEKIRVEFEEKGNQQHVKVVSLGPVVNAQELSLLTQQGFRGKNAIKATGDGMGIGLFTVSCICQRNNIQIEFSSDKDVKQRLKDIDYSEFTVDFWVNL